MVGNSESVDMELGSTCFILEVCKRDFTLGREEKWMSEQVLIFPGRRIKRMESQMYKDAVI
jgi:hypothetical protein